jgi:hypothetical protein
MREDARMRWRGHRIRSHRRQRFDRKGHGDIAIADSNWVWQWDRSGRACIMTVSYLAQSDQGPVVLRTCVARLLDADFIAN